MKQIILTNKELDSIACAALMEMVRNKDCYPKTLPKLKELIKWIITEEVNDNITFKIETL